MIVAAADGSALGNPGPAGWGWYVDDSCWASGGWSHGTNNMGELMAVLDLLRQTAELDDDLLIYCDSRYAINTVTTWMAGWKRKGWRKADGKVPENLELVKALDEQMATRRRRPRFEWVKGHAGHPLNEQADRLANSAATACQAGNTPDGGPGFQRAGAPGFLGDIPGPAVAGTTGAAGTAAGAMGVGDDLFSLMAGEAVGEPGELTDEQQVVALERSLLTAEVRADPAALDRLLHPQWSEIGSSGCLIQRAAILDRLPAVDASLEVIEVGKLADDVVLLVWRSVSDDGSRLRSSTWVRDGGRWRQRFHQGTPER